VPCDDGNACTSGDSCQAGECRGVPVVCTALDQCHAAGVCDPATGQCTNPALPNLTPCNDGNSSTSSDHCWNGVCAGLACQDPTAPDFCDTCAGRHSNFCTLCPNGANWCSACQLEANYCSRCRDDELYCEFCQGDFLTFCSVCQNRPQGVGNLYCETEFCAGSSAWCATCLHQGWTWYGGNMRGQMWCERCSHHPGYCEDCLGAPQYCATCMEDLPEWCVQCDPGGSIEARIDWCPRCTGTPEYCMNCRTLREGLPDYCPACIGTVPYCSECSEDAAYCASCASFGEERPDIYCPVCPDDAPCTG
jgi:hypothetical protein